MGRIKNASLFPSQPAIERQNLTMSALRILVPIKRVIDYAVSDLQGQGILFDQFGHRTTTSSRSDASIMNRPPADVSLPM
jgi:hypothetical protein